MTEPFDIVVLGAGSAGERSSVLLARQGRSVAVVEEALVGGVCPYLACIPSKALLRPAHIRAEAAPVPGLGIPPVDPGPLLAWRDTLVRHLDDGRRAGRLADEGITLVRGRGRLDGATRVVIDAADRVLEATEAVILATGAETVRPAIEGLDGVAYLTSDDLTVLGEIPESLTLVGGGIIGCELAQAYAALGSSVTVIHDAERLLDRHEPAAGRLVGAAMTDLGVEVVLADPVEAVRTDGEEMVLRLRSGREHRTVRLAVAVGRRPRLGGIGLETAGIDPEAPDLDGCYRAAPGLFVIGDAAADGMYTHMANAQADVVVGTLTGEGRRSVVEQISGERAPSVVFTAPQVASVGIRSVDVPDGGVVVEADLGDTAAAATMGEDVDGAVVAVFDRERRLIGATFVGPTAAEMLHAATIAIANRLTVDDLALAIPPFPTLSGIWDVVVGQARRRFDG